MANGVVVDGKLYCRKSPQAGAAYHGQFDNGAMITITPVSGNSDWWQTPWTNGATGYVMKAYVVSAGDTIKVTATNVNVRPGIGTGSGNPLYSVSTPLTSSVLDVGYTTDGGWIKIQPSGQSAGWIRYDFLTKTASAPGGGTPDPDNYLGIGTVIGGSQRMYASPSTSSTVLEYWVVGSTLPVYSCSTSGWYLIKYMGINGYMQMQHISLNGGGVTYNPTALDDVRNGIEALSTTSTNTNAIRNLQLLLNNNGQNCTVNGTYDIATKNAVSSTQTSNGISADGVCGQATLAVLEDTSTTSSWRTGPITAGRLARMGYKKIMLLPSTVTQLNAALVSFGIKNSRERLCHFLSQCLIESQYGEKVMESSYTPGVGGSKYYSPYYGAGFIQNTHQHQYKAFADWLQANGYAYAQVWHADAENTISKYATKYVADNYPILVSAWFWSIYKNINSTVDSNVGKSNFTQVKDVTKLVYGYYGEPTDTEAANKRLPHYEKALTQFI